MKIHRAISCFSMFVMNLRPYERRSAMERPMMVPTTPPRIILREAFLMTCSIWMTVRAIKRPNNDPINENGMLLSKLMYEMKNPLIEQAAIKRNRINKLMTPFLFLFSTCPHLFFKERRHGNQIYKKSPEQTHTSMKISRRGLIGSSRLRHEDEQRVLKVRTR